MEHTSLRTDWTTRWLGAAGLAAIAVIHLLDLPGKLEETKLIASLYILLIIGCVLGIGLLLRVQSRLAWMAAAVLAAAPFICYCLSRTVGLPTLTDDIGNWTEPLGLLSLVVEGALFLFAVTRSVPGLSVEPVRPRQPRRRG